MSEHVPALVRATLRFLVRGWLWWAVPLLLAVVLLVLLALLGSPVELLPFVYAPE